MTEYIHITAQKRNFRIPATLQLSESLWYKLNGQDARIARNADVRIARNGDARVARNTSYVNLRNIKAEKRDFRIRAEVNNG